MILIILLEFGLPTTHFSLIRPFLNFAVGTLFTIYGFTVLYDGADLRRNIKRAAISFGILLAVYGLLTLGYMWFGYGDAFANLSKRTIFEFVVLNYWGVPFCASIWYVQSVLYSLICFWLLRKFKRYDWILCIVLFVISILLGELAHLIGFSFFGYTYIPGNFLTRTMPYMLLGRLIRVHYNGVTRIFREGSMLYFIIGLVLSVGEFLALGYTGNLYYTNHFAGFILMAASLCIACTGAPEGFLARILINHSEFIYKGMYYLFNPLGYILIIAAMFICRTEEQYEFCDSFLGIAVIILTFTLSFVFSVLKRKRMIRKIDEEEAEEDINRL